MTEMTENIEEFRCPNCGFYGTNENLDFIILNDGTCNEAQCPECGQVVLVKDRTEEEDDIDDFDDDDSYDNY